MRGEKAIIVVGRTRIWGNEDNDKSGESVYNVR
jgi:hypothetical protein